MNFPQHWLRLVIGPAPAEAESIHVVARSEIQWGTPVFRAPALPTPHQLSRELPFTENFRRPVPRAR